MQTVDLIFVNAEIKVATENMKGRNHITKIYSLI